MKSGKATIIRCGPVAVRIRQENNNGYTSWVVDYPDRLKGRVRIKRSNFEEAKRLAEEAAVRVANGEQVESVLSTRDIAIYASATAILSPTGRTLETVAAEYAEAHQILNGRSIIEAARFYTSKTREFTQTDIQTVLNEFLGLKAGCSKEYLYELKRILKPFADAFPGCAHNVSGAEIDAWIKRQHGQTSQRNTRRILLTFFAFSKARKYLPSDWDEFHAVSKIGRPSSEIAIFTVEEVRKLLKSAGDHVPFIALGAFAGVRHFELRRLDWSAVGKDYVKLGKDVVKRHRTATRRLIPIQPNLAAWLKPFRKETGPVCIRKNMSNEIVEIASRAGVQWKQNALRHSFISYRLAQIKDTGAVALECGNSPKAIFSHYRELVSATEAKRYFSIFPDTKRTLKK